MSATPVASSAAAGHSVVAPRMARRTHRAHRREARSHWLAGWRDGRAHRPSLEDGSAIPDRLALLVSVSEEMLERHWKTVLESTYAARVELATIPDEIKLAITRSDRDASALAAHLATGPDRTRRFGEEQLPEDLVRMRRAREHAARTAELTEARAGHTDDVHRKAQRQEQLRESIALTLDSVRAAARADLARYDALATAYRRGVLRTHSDPLTVEQQAHRFTIPRPAWVRHADVEQFLRTAGAGSDR